MLVLLEIIIIIVTNFVLENFAYKWYKYSIIHYDRIVIFEGIDINKTNASKECIICNYWYIFDKDFKFQLNVYNKFCDVLIMSTDFINIAISNTQCVDIFILSVETAKEKP